MKIYLHFKPRNKPNNQLETFKVEIQESEIVSLEEFTKFTFLKHNKVIQYHHLKKYIFIDY